MTDHLETRAILAGRPGGDADLAPVMHPSTTFELESVDEGRAMATSTGSRAAGSSPSAWRAGCRR